MYEGKMYDVRRLRDERELVPYFLHEPERSAGRSADTYFEVGFTCKTALLQCFFKLVWGGDEKSVWVRLYAFLEQHFGIRGLGAAYKKNDVVLA